MLSYWCLCKPGINFNNWPFIALREYLEPNLTHARIIGKRPFSVKAIHSKQWQASRKERLDQLDHPDIQVDIATFASLLSFCRNTKALSDGRHVHSHMIKVGLEHNLFLGSLLVQLYGKCAVLDDALALFAKMHQRNVYLWNFMIKSYAEQGKRKKVFQLLDSMKQDGIIPDNMTFVCVLSVCASHAAIVEGRWVHIWIQKRELESDIVVGTALANMYGKCGSLEDAHKTFLGMPERDVVTWTTMISLFTQYGKAWQAFELFDQMQQDGVKPDKFSFVSILDACAHHTTLAKGMQVHKQIQDTGLELDVAVGTALVNMYGKCGSLKDASDVFDKMPKRNAVLWTAMITAFTQYGKGKEALELFNQMQRRGVTPDKITFISILDACATHATLTESKQMHRHIVYMGFESDVVVGTALVSMYGKYGSVEDAHKIFDKILQRDVVSWNAMFSVYVQNGQHKNALQLFNQMQQEIVPDRVTFLSLLAACTTLAECKYIHAHILDNDLESDIAVGTALVNMYGKCGSLDDSRKMFNKMLKRDMLCWNSMIAVYACHGHSEEVFPLIIQMQRDGYLPDKTTFVSILASYSSPEVLAECKQMHSCILYRGLDSDVVVSNALINSYFKCGSAEDAWIVFNQMPERDVVSWTIMIAAYAKRTRLKEAIQLFDQLEMQEFLPDKVTFLSILTVCASQAALVEGEWIHSCIMNHGLESDVMLGTALVNLYGKCGCVTDSGRIFDKMVERDLLSWTAMIAVYAQGGQDKEVMHLFDQMQLEGFLPDRVSSVNILAACASQRILTKGMKIHVHSLDSGFESDVMVGTALLNMYGKCGTLDDAQRIFIKMPERTVVSWNAMIAVYVEHGEGKEALQMYHQMQQEGLMGDSVTFISILLACACEGVQTEGQQVHVCISDSRLETDLLVGTALVNMYAKFASLKDAQRIFDKLPNRDVVSWNAMISGYAQHGKGKEALKLFEQMLCEEVLSDEITFISVLAGCSHSGLVDECCHYCASMFQDHGISPNLEHYVCVIDLLGRAGQLDEAEKLIDSLPLQPTVVPFMTLLGSCRYNRDTMHGKHAANQVLELDPENTAPYLLLSNIYAAGDRGNDEEKFINQMWNNSVKDKSRSYLAEIKGKVNDFLVKHQLRCQSQQILAEFQLINE